jgi:hypothetical protein
MKSTDHFVKDFISKKKKRCDATKALLTVAGCQWTDFFFGITANERKWNSISQT